MSLQSTGALGRLFLFALACLGAASLATLPSAASADPLTPVVSTVFVVRHAQKADPQDNTPGAVLSAQGKAAADQLAATLRSAGIQAVFATPTTRARDTAKPTATLFGLEVTEYQAPADLATLINEKWFGRPVLIVGHSNTVPALIKSLGGDPIGDLGPDEYDNLFILTIAQDMGGRTVATTRLRLPQP